MTPDHGSTGGSASSFPELLRGLRRAAGLTQADLAARAAVGVRTVRDLERGRSSRPQRTTVELLAAALGLAGPSRMEFVASARGARTAEPARSDEDSTVTAPAGRLPVALGLPPPGILVGRDLDVVKVSGMLAQADSAGPALVSLVGLAGVGKTALALAVAQETGAWHPAGVAGIVVTEISTASDVLSAVATVFGVARASDLADRLAGGPALLLVDAIERAPGAVVEALHRLVVMAPTLRVLVTGRHPVGLRGEWVWPVTPLELPPPDAPADLRVLSGYPAVALFLARLRQVRRDPPRADEIDALVGLVRRLGGLPLAIELAAARGRILDLKQILDRYGDRLLELARSSPTWLAEAGTTQAATGRAALTTLRDSVAASYGLISPADQAALRRLSAFRNRWSVELAEAVLADLPGAVDRPRAVDRPGAVDQPGAVGRPGAVDRPVGADPVPMLERLMELGLLSARGTGSVRFRLLDVVRDFAEQRAAVDAELPAIRRRHAMIFARLAAAVAPKLTGASLTTAVHQLDEVASDLWAALAYAANDDPHTALRLAASLPRWWRFRGRDVAGRQWLHRLLADPRTADADPGTRAWAQVGLAQLAAEHDAGPQELPAVRAALAQFQRSGDVGGELAARNMLSRLLIVTGEHDEAREHSLAVLAVAGRTGLVRDVAVAQNNLTWHEIRVGDLRAARRRLAAVDRLSVQCGEDRLRVLARANLAEVARLDGRYADAVDLGRRVIATLTDLGDPGHRRRVLGTVGLALAQDGRLDEAGAVLDELRAWVAGGGDRSDADPTCARAATGRGTSPPFGESPGPVAARREDGVCALIEATLAVWRGNREYAAEWFGAAAQAYTGCGDLRDVAEALVGLVANTDDPAVRAAERSRLEQVCRDGGISLLPREWELIGPAGSDGSAVGLERREQNRPPTMPSAQFRSRHTPGSPPVR
ncbi:ATP-binding protein [Micromonospora sonneratiae]|uniref:ATP-binding protein n=1 Tax=Micromonospora sonneratiae TaxID=1184706 RepID=A0ABW3YC03_9ACTN